MRDIIVQFYRRNKQNKFKHFLLRVSLTFIFIIIFSRITNYIINDLIFKTPKPNLTMTGSALDFIYYIFSKEGLIFFTFIILGLFLIDFFSYKNRNKSQ
ncbi:hypothetical protein GOQ27_06085 [Clostridium sp. D2Q-11]|uniref:Uncharacterized protein n=1 Tax=Anaeromonas frigoriresistens TaxID=2683708 RepID=A0A942V0Y1_9FIRM|nr:hypothetical protein [Anaeromonas frigoriresistens]MBS4538022.1 hypothetical protein [Anaeromonas frigoriresistens]